MKPSPDAERSPADRAIGICEPRPQASGEECGTYLIGHPQAWCERDIVGGWSHGDL